MVKADGPEVHASRKRLWQIAHGERFAFGKSESGSYLNGDLVIEAKALYLIPPFGFMRCRELWLSRGRHGSTSRDYDAIPHLL
jgi:hypothetical protein